MTRRIKHPRYVIIKCSRYYTGGSSYNGPTCVNAGIKGGKIYRSKIIAERDAKILSEWNPVGFEVLRYKRNKPKKFPCGKYSCVVWKWVCLNRSPRGL